MELWSIIGDLHELGANLVKIYKCVPSVAFDEDYCSRVDKTSESFKELCTNLLPGSGPQCLPYFASPLCCYHLPRKPRNN